MFQLLLVKGDKLCIFPKMRAITIKTFRVVVNQPINLQPILWIFIGGGTNKSAMKLLRVGKKKKWHTALVDCYAISSQVPLNSRILRSCNFIANKYIISLYLCIKINQPKQIYPSIDLSAVQRYQYNDRYHKLFLPILNNLQKLIAYRYTQFIKIKMGAVVPGSQSNERQQPNRQFSYGSTSCNCLYLICFFPCCIGLYPNTAYHTLVFNNQKKQIEKYFNGFGFAVCFPSKLQLVINYNQIVSIENQTTINTRQSQVQTFYQYITSILIKCRDSKIYQLYIPENACNCNCCDCDPWRYDQSQIYHNERVSKEIVTYWRRLQQNGSQRQLIQVGQIHPN